MKELLPKANQILIDKFKSLPIPEICPLMKSSDRTFNNQIIDQGDWYYIGEVNENNKPNGYGFELHKDKDWIYEGYCVNGDR